MKTLINIIFNEIFLKHPEFTFSITVNKKKYTVTFLNSKKIFNLIKNIEEKEIKFVLNSKNKKKFFQYLINNYNLLKTEIIKIYNKINNLEEKNKKVNDYIITKKGNIISPYFSKHSIIQLIKRSLIFEENFKNHQNFNKEITKTNKKILRLLKNKKIKNLNEIDEDLIVKIKHIFIEYLDYKLKGFQPEKTFYRRNDKYHIKKREKIYNDSKNNIIKLYVYPFLITYNNKTNKIITIELYSSNLPKINRLNKLTSKDLNNDIIKKYYKTNDKKKEEKQIKQNFSLNL